MSDNVLTFPTAQPPVSRIRSRDKALGLLLPKFLGVLWERGEPGAPAGSVRAFVGGDLELGAFEVRPGGYGLSVWDRATEWDSKKVFSAHIGSRTVIDGVWPYWDGRCSILSWKRGTWEDRIVAERVEDRTLAHLLHAGLTRRKL